MKAKNIRTPRTFAGEPLPQRLCDLKRERAVLEEEVRQLRAAVQIWQDVSRLTSARNAAGETGNSERN